MWFAHIRAQLIDKLLKSLNPATEVNIPIQNILSYPQAWPSLSKNIRRCLTNRFPYGVIYQISSDEIYIIAIMQLNRKPKYWENRKKTGFKLQMPIFGRLIEKIT